MKTLKKSLCLILAVVMVVGVLAVSASADTYLDDSDIEYTEAVEVLSLIGVINGDDEGNFNPQETLTREQAAKIITYIINQDNAESLATSATFTDVASSRWSAGYISYCVSQSIINGLGDGTFDPTGELTGYAWAKMLLCALGYDSDYEGYTGSSWTSNVVADAEEIELASGIKGFDYSDAITREEACQMAFNALNIEDDEDGAYIVKYSSSGQNVSVTGSDISVSVTSGAVAEQTSKTLNDKYFEVEVEDTTDVFGRPSTTYTNDDGDTYECVEEPDYETSTRVNSKVIYAALGLSSAEDTYAYYIDGEEQEDAETIQKTTDKIGRNGALTQVFDTDDGIVLTIIYSYVGEVTDVDEDDDETTYTIKAYGNGVSGTYEFVTEDAYDVEEDDIIYFTYSAEDDEIQSIGTCDVAEGVTITKVTSGTSSISNFVADGTTYKLSYKSVDVDSDVIVYDDTVDVYLDEYGYAIYAETYSGSSGNYLIVLDVTTNGVAFDDTYYAKVVTMDGEEEVITYDADDSDDFDEDTLYVVEYDIDDDDEDLYILTDITSVRVDDGTASVTNGKVSIGDLGKGNSSTIYIVEVEDDDDTEYDVYVGYKNVPDVDEADGVSYTKSGKTYATVVYLGGGDVGDSSTNNVLFAIDSGSNLIQDSTNSTGYYTYNAVVDGDIVEVSVNKSVNASKLADAETYVLASSITVNSKGFVSGITLLDEDEYAQATGVNYSDGVVEVEFDEDEDDYTDLLSLDDDIVVYYIDEDGEITEIDLDDISEDEDDIVVYVFDDDDLVYELYIFEIDD